MANIKKLLDFRDRITDAINVLIRLDNEHYPLPTLGHLQNMSAELEKDCQPADVIVDIVSDNDYLQHDDLYVTLLQPLFKCDFGAGCAIVDGMKYDWWDGLNGKLERQGCSVNEIKEYTEITDRITSLVRDSLRALKRDLGSIGIHTGDANSTNSGNTNVTIEQHILDKVYDECNGKLWHDINKEDFKKMLVSGDIGFQIKNGNRQRVVALLNRISFTISDEKAKSAWVANVERALEVERLSRIYELDEMNSEPSKKFNRFLNDIYAK